MAKTRRLGNDKAKKLEYDPSLLLKLENLKEQVTFLENENLFLKRQLDNFKSHNIKLFKKGQYSDSTRANPVSRPQTQKSIIFLRFQDFIGFITRFSRK